MDFYVKRNLGSAISKKNIKTPNPGPSLTQPGQIFNIASNFRIGESAGPIVDLTGNSKVGNPSG